MLKNLTARAAPAVVVSPLFSHAFCAEAGTWIAFFCRDDYFEKPTLQPAVIRLAA
jgi:hypothetical protein